MFELRYVRSAFGECCCYRSDMPSGSSRKTYTIKRTNGLKRVKIRLVYQIVYILWKYSEAKKGERRSYKKRVLGRIKRKRVLVVRV